MPVSHWLGTRIQQEIYFTSKELYTEKRPYWTASWKSNHRGWAVFQLTLRLIPTAEMTHFVLSDSTIWQKIGLGHEMLMAETETRGRKPRPQPQKWAYSHIASNHCIQWVVSAIYHVQYRKIQQAHLAFADFLLYQIFRGATLPKTEQLFSSNVNHGLRHAADFQRLVHDCHRRICKPALYRRTWTRHGNTTTLHVCGHRGGRHYSVWPQLCWRHRFNANFGNYVEPNDTINNRGWNNKQLTKSTADHTNKSQSSTLSQKQQPPFSMFAIELGQDIDYQCRVDIGVLDIVFSIY